PLSRQSTCFQTRRERHCTTSEKTPAPPRAKGNQDDQEDRRRPRPRRPAESPVSNFTTEPARPTAEAPRPRPTRCRNASEKMRNEVAARRVCHRAQSGVADGCEIETQDCFFADRMGVLESQLHEEIVRMLAIHDGLAKCCFAGLKQFRITPLRHRGRIEAQHGPKQKA